MKCVRVMACVALALVGCQGKDPDRDAVKTSYVHKYGVKVSKSDWESRGQSGEVVSSMPDGVRVTKTYRAGVLEGDTTYTYPHSRVIQKRLTVRAGEVVKGTLYFISGMPKEEVEYRPNESKTVTRWYESGVPQASEIYEDGLLVAGEYYNPQNNLESEVANFEGKRINRSESGDLLSTDQIEQGQIVARTTYYPHGTPHAIEPYVNGKVEGLRRTFQMGGEPQTTEEWVAGKQHGLTTSFKAGQKVSEVVYVMGRKEGIERVYADGEFLVEEVSWDGGERHGPATSYIDGKSKTRWFYRGKPTSRIGYRQKTQ